MSLYSKININLIDDGNHDNDKLYLYYREILKKRLIKPSLCNDYLNKYSNKILTNPNQLNYAPFINRCNIKININANKVINGRLGNKDINYIHVWKSGGSSVEALLEKHLNLTHITINWLNIYNKHKSEYIKTFNLYKNSFLFSYVRPPVDRYLSAYFENQKRNQIVNNNSKYKNNITRFQSFLDDKYNIYRKTLNYLNQCNDIDSKCLNKYLNILVSRKVFYDKHFLSQMEYLSRNNFSKWPIDYVGHLYYDMDNMTFKIINYFNPNITKRNYKDTHLRDRHEQDYYTKWSGYSIDINLLNDNDIYKICHIYWMDYICIPFDIPHQCNLTELLEIHYGKHVEYDDCYTMSIK